MRIDRYSFDESFRAAVEITGFHGDKSVPHEAIASGRIVSLGRNVRTALSGLLEEGQDVVILMTNPVNGNRTIGDLMKGLREDGSFSTKCDVGSVVEFFGCELLNDDEIDARSFIVQRLSEGSSQ